MNKQMDWQQFEEKLSKGTSIEELLGLVESTEASAEGTQDTAAADVTDSNVLSWHDNVKVSMPEAILPLKFVYPISNYAHTEEEMSTAANKKPDSLALKWPSLSLENLLPDCFSSKAQHVLNHELGIEVSLKN